MVWAFPLSLATTYGITICFLFLWVLRCFSSPGLPLYIFRDISNFIGIGFPIRKSADQFVLTNPRSLSQFITSFIASESLGILHTLLFFFFLKNY